MHAFTEFGRKFEEQETWRREGTGFDWKTETLGLRGLSNGNNKEMQMGLL